MLNVSHNNITCKGAAYLGKALETNAPLKTLDILGNSISDDGVVALLASCSCLLKISQNTR